MKINLYIFIAIIMGIIIFCLLIEAKHYNSKNNVPIIIVNNTAVPYIPLGEFKITHYTHTGNRCKNGHYPTLKTIAVDKKIIPLGSLVYIENYGIMVAMDTGRAIKGNRIDVFVDTKKEATEKGVKRAKVYVIGD